MSRIEIVNAIIATAIVTLSFYSVAPAQDYVLELGTNGAVILPHHTVMNTGERVTIEAWARRLAGAQGVWAMQRYQGGAEHKTLEVREDGSVNFIYAGSPWQSGGLNQPAGTFPVDGQWHHLAFVRHAGGAFELYVDGAVAMAGGPGPCWLTCGIINGTPETKIEVRPATTGGPTGGWQMDEVRWSRIDRYSGPFTPEQRFTEDAQTVLLLHFDEGSGALVADTGPAGQVGSLSGSYQWVSDYAPKVYCTSKLNSLGCLPAIGWNGSPTVSGPIDDFYVTASSVLNRKPGIMLWSMGPGSSPLGGGTLCLAPPVIRTPGQSSGGTPAPVNDCSGACSFHFGHAYAQSYFLTAGQTVYAQYWSRDPGFPVPNNIGLTDGLRFTLLP